MELKDVGRTMSETAAQPIQEAKPGKKIYPTLSLEVFPDELKDKPIGHVCRLTIVVRKKGDMENYDGKGQRIELEVQKVGYASSGQKTKEEYKNMKADEREKYDRESLEDDSKDEPAE